MCTVVTSWRPGAAPRVLAVRDELHDREFDGPDRWWPDHPGVVGGRDRRAGGSWCVSDPATGVSALVLNRPERPTGTPSRGVLPLAAVEHQSRWVEHVDHSAMAGFILVLVAPTGAAAWEWDGARLLRRDLPPGLHVVTPHGVDPGDERALRMTPLLADRSWVDVLAGERPSAADDALFVRREFDGGVYGTVFAQLIDAEPGRLRLRHSRTPWAPGSWTEQAWTSHLAVHASSRSPRTVS